MSLLTLIQTSAGPRYHLDGQPLSNRDPIEILTSWGTWRRGNFAWNGLPEDSPWFLTTGFSQAIEPNANVRRPDPLPLPELPE